MKKLITWLCIISVLLLLLFYAVSASGAENSEPALENAAAEAERAIARARQMVTNPDEGLESLVRGGTGLLSKGAAWEPLARKKLRSAAMFAVEIEAMLAPYLPPQGVSALRYMNLGIGDSVIQKIEFAPYASDFTNRLPMQKMHARGEILAGPRPHDGKLFWRVRFSNEHEGWLPEYALTKEFPYHPALIGAACWIQGNVATYKMVASLRSYQEDELVGERYAVLKDMFASIVAAYECALGMYSLPESIRVLGASEAMRYREIIKKNFPIMQEQQKQIQKKSADGRVDAGEESTIIKAILGDEVEREKKGQQRIMIPPPEREGDPNRKFTPGIPIGIH